MKLSRRMRYVLKWNGPYCVTDYKRQRRAVRATIGKGSPMQRFVATAYECRFRGFYPATEEEMLRRCGQLENSKLHPERAAELARTLGRAGMSAQDAARGFRALARAFDWAGQQFVASLKKGGSKL